MMERRAAPRHEPATPMKAKVRAALSVRLVDISARGAQLEVREPLSPHDHCELRLFAEDMELTLRAVVRRCQVWGHGALEDGQKVLLYRAGVQFEEQASESVARLEELMPALFKGGSHPATLHPAPGTR